MEAVINWKRYSTETGEILYQKEYISPYIPDRISFVSLYRTPKGAFFFYHEEYTLEGKTVQQRIQPASPEEVYKFLVTQGKTELANKLFADLIEDA